MQRNYTNVNLNHASLARARASSEIFSFRSIDEEGTDFLGHRFLLKSSTRDCDRSCNPVRSQPNQTDERDEGGRSARSREENERADESQLLSPDQGRPPTPLPVVYRYYYQIPASPCLIARASKRSVRKEDSESSHYRARACVGSIPA